jgi:hypothetical protein
LRGEEHASLSGELAGRNMASSGGGERYSALPFCDETVIGPQVPALNTNSILAPLLSFKLSLKFIFLGMMCETVKPFSTTFPPANFSCPSSPIHA